MATGTGNGMPYTLPAPMAMSTEMGEQSDFGRMARGSAGVTELVAIMEQQPAERRAGVFFEGQPWSVAKLAKEHVARMQSHRTLQENIMILGQIYEIALQKNDAGAIKAFDGTALKCCFAASSATGSWQTWELLGKNPEHEHHVLNVSDGKDGHGRFRQKSRTS